MSWLSDLLDRLRRRRKPTVPPTPIPPPAGDFAAQLLALHNDARAQAGLPALRLNPKLSAAAQGHTNFMSQVGRLGHSGIGDGDPWSRIRAQGYEFTDAGENVAEGYPSPSEVMTGWLNSPGHRENILRAVFTEIGFGRAGLYWCTDFGKPGLSVGLAPFHTSGGLRF